MDKEDELGIKLLKTAYHIAKRELPKEEFRHHLEFANSVGADFGPILSEDAMVTYCSNKSVTELQNAISDVILAERISDIHSSGVYSLVLDESTDNGNKKRLLVYAQHFRDHKLDYSLLSNVQIKVGSASAVNIVKLVLEELKQKNIDITKMVGISTDGASVMTGKTGGVVTLLREHSPSLVGVHCAAHRTALAASQAARDIPEMKEYARTVSNIFRYFHNSALRSNRLRDIQSVLNQPLLKFAEVHSVRWLSLESAVIALYRTYPALVMCLEREATVDASAKGLFKEVSQFRFIAFTHLMMDILPFIGRLCKNFQSDSLDFSSVQPLVSSTCQSLQDLCEVDGVFVSKLTDFVKCDNGKVTYSRPLQESTSDSVKLGIADNFAFEGFDSDNEEEEMEMTGFSPELQYYTQQKDVLNRVIPAYINTLTRNLEARFEQSRVIDAMKVLVPSNIRDAESTARYGNEEIRILAEQYQHHIESLDMCMLEYKQYKNLVKCSYAMETLPDITRIFSQKYQKEFPNMISLLKCCAVLPMTSVKCERGFSTQNRIKCRLRTSMNNRTLDTLMRISEDGPCIKNFNFESALAKWKKEKARKLYAM